MYFREKNRLLKVGSLTEHLNDDTGSRVKFYHQHLFQSIDDSLKDDDSLRQFAQRDQSPKLHKFESLLNV